MNEQTKAEDFDVFAEETFGSAYDEFRRLRNECPMARSEGFGGFWMATRYEDVAKMLRDDNYITSVRNIVPGSSNLMRTPPLRYDPPEHTPYRRTLDRALSKGRVERLGPSIRKHSEDLLDEFIALGEGDYVELVGSKLPMLAFGDWMGMTDEQTQRMWELSRIYIRAFVAYDRPTVAECVEGFIEVARELIAHRRAHPRPAAECPVASLMEAERDGEVLMTEELLLNCVRQVLVVGMAAPPMIFASMIVHLCQNPDLFEQLRAMYREDKTVSARAMEEFVRLYTPYRGFARSSKTEVEWHGRTIVPGEAIALSFASANRDERMFENPDEFILDRPNIRKHLAFGAGAHQCAGMPIARLQMTIGLETLLEKVGTMELAGELKMSSMPEIGPIAVPIRVTAA